MGMESLRIKKCCCCTLYTGCLIIAIISLLSTTLALFGINGDYRENRDLYNEQNKVAYQANMMFKGLACAVSIILCICLIYGTIKKNRKMIKGWIILKGIECVLVLLLCCKLIYDLVVARGQAQGIIGGVLVAAILEFVLCCYFWLVVWSHYLELGDEEEEAARRNLPEGTKLSDVNASSNC